MEEKIFKVLSILRHRLVTDGRGVTTLVALSGCPLCCKYCLNKRILQKNNYKTYLTKELLDELLIDYCYFMATGGGVTFGGGEALLHARAILEFAGQMPEYMSLNVESSLALDLDEEIFDELLQKVNHFIIDIKTLDEKLYRQYTGQAIDKMRYNLSKIIDKGYQSKCKIRIPVIPGYKDRIVAKKEASSIKEMGFDNVEVFDYIIRD